MTDRIDCQLGLDDLKVLIDYYDNSITELEKKLAEKRYSYKYYQSKSWLTATESTRRKLLELKQKTEYLVDMYNILFNINNN